jgi:hypothetical protein
MIKMKKLTMSILLCLSSTILFSQIKRHKTTTTFSKITTSDRLTYVITDSVNVKNGKGEIIKVFTTLAVGKDIWDKATLRWRESEYLDYVVNEIAENAKESATNQLSFEPLNNNHISYDNKTGLYTSNYRMMARNGFGNLVETTVFAFCKTRPW